MLNRTNVERLKKWTGFVGVLMIIGGILNCLSIVGLIPGVIIIILGVKLTSAKKHCANLLEGGTEQGDGYDKLNGILDSLSGFFAIQGVLIIIGLILSVLMIIIGIVFAASLPALFDSFNPDLLGTTPF